MPVEGAREAGDQATNLDLPRARASNPGHRRPTAVMLVDGYYLRTSARPGRDGWLATPRPSGSATTLLTEPRYHQDSEDVQHAMPSPWAAPGCPESSSNRVAIHEGVGREHPGDLATVSWPDVHESPQMDDTTMS